VVQVAKVYLYREEDPPESACVRAAAECRVVNVRERDVLAGEEVGCVVQGVAEEDLVETMQMWYH